MWGRDGECRVYTNAVRARALDRFALSRGARISMPVPPPKTLPSQEAVEAEEKGPTRKRPPRPKKGLRTSASAPELGKPPPAPSKDSLTTPTTRDVTSRPPSRGTTPLPDRDVTPRQSPRLTPQQMAESANRLSRPVRKYSDNPYKPALTLSASHQGLGVRRSAPSYGFGVASRDVANKVFVSQQHTITVKYGTNSPGPVHKLHPSIGGKQPDGRKPDPPVWRFNKADRYLYGYGTPMQKPGPTTYTMRPYEPSKAATFGVSTRDVARKVFISQQHTLTIRAGTQSPGHVYNVKSCVGGKQPDGRIANAPSYSICGKARAKDEPGLDTPGAIYHLPRAHGAQPDSTHRSEPSWGMGGKARAKDEPGLDTPGAIYNLPSTLERQPNARIRNAPVPSFSRRSRWAELEREARHNSVPGPGYYG